MLSSKQAYNIFLVDDDNEYLEILNQHLNKQMNPSGGDKKEYHLHTYTNADDCIKNLSIKPDFIILDYFLPGMNGYEALIEIKRIIPEVHVILLSGNEDIELMERALKNGAYHYLIKTEYTVPIIKKDINNILKHVELMRENNELRKSVKKTKTTFIIIILFIFVLFIMLQIKI